MHRPRILFGIGLIALLAASFLYSGCAAEPPPSPPATAAKPAAAAPTQAKPAAAAPTAAKPAAAPAPAPTSAPAAPAPAKARQGGELKVGLWQEPSALDPTNANGIALRPISLLYDTLVVLDQKFTPQPGLAQSWQESPDGKSYTLKLRSGVKFHDGTPFNAEAVKTSLDHANRKEATARFEIDLKAVYVGTDVVDDMTVRVNLKEPFAPFMQALGTHYYAPVSPAALKKYGKDYDRNPVGTGPFTFVEWSANDHITLKKNPDYAWAPALYKQQGPANLDRVTFRLLPEASVRLGTVETGEMDLIEEPPLQDLPKIESEKKFPVFKLSLPGPGLFIPINVERPPTNDPAVRRAILYATDQDAISKTVFHGVYPASHGPLVPATFGASEAAAKAYRYDPAKARETLEAAGWKVGAGGIRAKDGQPLRMKMYIISDVFPMLPVSELLQAQLREVGIDMEIAAMARPAWTEGISRGDHHLRVAWRDVPDPDVLRPVFHSSMIATSVNTSFLRDPKFDALLEQGYQVTDPTQRAGVYAEIQKYIMDNGLMIPIAERMNVIVARPRVQGLAFDPAGRPQYYGVWLNN